MGAKDDKQLEAARALVRNLAGRLNVGSASSPDGM